MENSSKLEQAVIDELKKEEKDIQLQTAIKYVAGKNKSLHTEISSCAGF